MLHIQSETDIFRYDEKSCNKNEIQKLKYNDIAKAKLLDLKITYNTKIGPTIKLQEKTPKNVIYTNIISAAQGEILRQKVSIELEPARRVSFYYI